MAYKCTFSKEPGVKLLTSLSGKVAIINRKLPNLILPELLLQGESQLKSVVYLNFRKNSCRWELSWWETEVVLLE